MSDSDDTDILLLIPPDFFVAESLDESLKYDIPDVGVIKPIKTPPNHCGSKNILANVKTSKMNQKYEPICRASPIASSSKHLPTYSSLDAIELRSRTPSKINDDNFLKEIDSYLAGRSQASSKLNDINAILLSNGITPLHFNNKTNVPLEHSPMARPRDETLNQTPARTISKPTMPEIQSPFTRDEISQHLDASRMSEWSMALKQHSSSKQGDKLVNLNQIWDADKSVNSMDINEEQLRRHQYERQVQSLQNQIKEYQNKFSVAIKIDQTKNEALTRLHETNSNLMDNITKLEQSLSGMELKILREKDIHSEYNDMKIKNQLLDKELLDAIKISKFLQEKNQALEEKVNYLLQSTTEMRELNRKQLDEAETRLSNAKHTEDQLNNQILKLQYDIIVLQNKCDNYVGSHDNFLREEQRTKSLEQENNELKQKLDLITSREKDMVKELEVQRISLKAYYQSQLEQVVSVKVAEFQKQLDTVEETVKAEARRNERMLAEKAIKQIELISQKNEQEFALLAEKHKQETEFFHLRLNTANKTIAQMEAKLKAERTDIAKRLHNVIESQWQQTLEIISNPQEQPKISKSKKFERSHFNNHSADLDQQVLSIAGLNFNSKMDGNNSSGTINNRRANAS